MSEPSKVTVAEYIRTWLDGAHELSPKTAERYRQLAEQQIIPHLGAVQLQKLKPSQVQDWHSIIMREGGKEGRSLSARTVGHAHRVLHRALQRARENETLPRNVASLIRPGRAWCRVGNDWKGTGGAILGFLLEHNGAKPMARFYAKGALWMAVILLASSLGHGGTFAASPGASNTPEKTVPQGKDPPGADNGEQMLPPTDHKEVIPPPPIGDEDIYTEAPNPNAGHEEEVIPPPAPDEEPSVTPH